MKHLILAAAAFAASSTAAVAEANLTYGSWAPSSDPASLAMDDFIAEVAEASSGSISFETHYDSSVVSMRTVLGSIDDNLVDAGYIAGAIYQAELPIDSMLGQYASIQANPFSISAAVTEFVLNDCADCLAETAAHGIRALAYAGTPHFYLMCKNPITSFAELQGRSIRAASANLRFVDFIGATPVNTPTVEVMEAIQRGQVECAIGSIFWLQAYSLWDAVGYVVDLPVGQYNNGLVFGINQDVWDNDLSAEDRAIIVEHLPTLVTQTAVHGIAAAEAVRAESIARGVVWGEPTDEMRATLEAWFAAEPAAVQAWGEDHGIANAAEIVAGFAATVADWNARVAEQGGDADAVRAELAARVYDNL